MSTFLDGVYAAIYAGLFIFIVWLVIWGIERLGRHEANREKALAWMFLTFEDAAGEKMRAAWLEKPGKFITELKAWNLSREMRSRLRSEAADRRR